MAAIAACRTCGTEPLEHARFCHGCGSPVEHAAIRAEFKQVTVLFADVVRSMNLASAVGTERLREIMADLADRCAAVVQRFGGTLDKFTGDGIMAVFGAPLALEDHAIRACLAALGIQEETMRLASEVKDHDGVDLRLRVGLNSGQVIAGEIGSASLGYTAIGEQVGLAQRMESAAPPGGVMLSASTARLVDGTASLGEVEHVHIKGTDELVGAQRLLSVPEGRRAAGRAQSNLVGRRGEMATVVDLFQRFTDGHGAVVTAVGPPGIGKSRLVREVAAMAGRRGVEVFTTFCESHTSQVPFHAVARLLREATGVNGIDPQAARARIRTQASHVAPDDLVLLDDLLGIADRDVELPQIDPDARRRRLTALVNAASLAREAPAFFVVEDAHWIDEFSESMLAEFFPMILQTPSLVLVTYRPEYRGVLTRMAGAQAIALAPLTDSETAALVSQLLGSDSSIGEVAKAITDNAAGNPFFAEEMVRELAERSVLDGDRGSYRCASHIAEVTVPATLHATLGARIDRLSPGAKRTLNAAAVIGSRLDAELLNSVVDRVQLEPLIDADLVEQVMWGPRAEYAFCHPLIRTVAYASQLKADRAALHRQLAAVIGQRGPGSADENAALIAEHLEAARDLPGAYAAHMRAGSWLMARDIVAARRSWERARQVADALPSGFPERVALRIHPRTMLCSSTWRVDVSADATGFDDLRELCTASGNQVSLAAGLSGAILSLTMANRHHEAGRLASEQIALFDSVVDRMSMFAVMSAAMFAKLHTGEVAEALRVAQMVIDLLAGDGSKGNISGLGSPLAVALLYRAHGRASLGEPSWRADLKRAIAIQQDLQGPSAVVIVITYGYTLAVTNGLLLPDPAALADTADVLHNAEKSGDDAALALAQVAHGLLLTHAASPTDVGTGLELMSKAREAQLRQRNLLGVAMVDIRRALLKADTGDVDDAIAIARATVNELTESGEVLICGAANAAFVTALLLRGNDTDMDEAQAAIDRLAATSVEPGFVVNELSLLRMRVLVARAQGDDTAYRDLVDRYHGMAKRLGFQGHTAWAEAMP